MPMIWMVTERTLRVTSKRTGEEVPYGEPLTHVLFFADYKVAKAHAEQENNCQPYTDWIEGLCVHTHSTVERVNLMHTPSVKIVDTIPPCKQ